jgi:hypothetical protein
MRDRPHTERTAFAGDRLEARALWALRMAFEPLPVSLERHRGHWDAILGRDGRWAGGLRVAARRETIHDALREVSDLLRKVGRRRLIEQLTRATGGGPIELPEEWFERSSTIRMEVST